MRLRDLFEAPIADLAFIDRSGEDVTFWNGDTAKREHSFGDDDRKIMTHPSWKAKVVKVFRNTPHPINVYAVNAKWLTIVDPAFQDYHDASKPFSKTVMTKPVLKAEDFRAFGGSYTEEAFLATFKFLPPDWQSSINFVMVENEGIDRIPLTPWMIGHRMIHALASDYTRGPNNQSYYRHIGYAVHEVRDALEAISNEISPWPFDSSDEQRLDLYSKLATFGSARHGKLSADPTRAGEFIIELFTQYLIRGDFDFRAEAVIQDKSVLERVEWRIGRAKQHLALALEKAVGQLIVF